MRYLLLTQLAIAGYFTGIIWLVQTVVYPQLLNIPKQGFEKIHASYTQTMGRVVGPLMLLELILAFGTVLCFHTRGALGLSLLALGCTGICWLSTAAVQVPLHTALRQGWEAEAIQQLVRTNWIRTVAWTTRLILLIVWIFPLKCL